MIDAASTDTATPVPRALAPPAARETPFCDCPGCGRRIPVKRWLASRRRAQTCSDYCTNLKSRLRNPRLSEASEAQLRLALDGPRPGPKRPAQPRTIQERFEGWLDENPELYSRIRHYAYAALKAGRPRFGIAAIIERVRWDVEVEARGDAFKVNNYRSRIVRKLIDEDPRFEDLFETRELKSA